MVKGGWQVCALMTSVAVIASVVILAQACGGGSAGEDVTPTATSPPTSTAGSETPTPGQSFGWPGRGGGDMPDITPGAGMPDFTSGAGMPNFTPGAAMPDFTPGAGAPGQALFIGGDSEEFAAFLGIPFEQLESELNAEGATPASVAEAHGRTREELKSFFTEELQANLNEAVAAGTMSQEVADSMFERQASRIDDIIDGNMPSGIPGGAPSGQ